MPEPTMIELWGKFSEGEKHGLLVLSGKASLVELSISTIESIKKKIGGYVSYIDGCTCDECSAFRKLFGDNDGTNHG